MPNPTRIAAWETRTQAAITAFQTIDTGNGDAMEYAYMASAVANLTSWADPQALAYLDAMRATQNADGTYGLNVAKDAFGDGTINPISTGYTVTMAHHVGTVLLEAYRAGTAPASELTQLAVKIAAMHQFTTSAGRCLAYSTSTNDWGTTPPKSLYQVHNVTATAASFLWQVRAIQPVVAATLIVDMIRHLVAAYKPTWSGWAYSANTATVKQDNDHQSATAEGCWMVCPSIGREAAYALMTTTGTLPLDPLAHMRLISLPGDINSMSTTEPGQTIWLVMGDQYLDEFDGFLAAQAGAMDRTAQAAVCAGRNAAAARL